MKSASSIVWPDFLPPKLDEVDRWSEPLKFLPVLFVIGNIIMVYCIYMVHYGWPTIQNSASSLWKCLPVYAFNFVSMLLVTTYVRCLLTPPGTVPSKDPKWQYQGELDSESDQPSKSGLVEIKRSGERRYCKWCAKYKPDRCHHCRVCRMCILRMDHHCPWIYNCVGFRNHKFFFLLLLYSVVDCHIVTWSMATTVWRACAPETPFLRMFSLLFCETLTGCFMLMVTIFFGFHLWLMLKAMTTIEFCEKYMKSGGYDTSVYHRGLYGNIKAVLGDNMFLWLLPANPPSGDGTTFRDRSKLLARDLEASRGDRKRLHQRNYGATCRAAQDDLPTVRERRLETAGETGGELEPTPRGKVEAGTGAAPDESGGEADASDGGVRMTASSTDTQMTSRG